MTNSSAKVLLKNGGTALIEIAPVPGSEQVLTPYSAGNDENSTVTEKSTPRPIADLAKSAGYAFEIARNLVNEFQEVFPESESELSFGLSFEGKLDAKLVSAGASATLNVTIRIGQGK